MKRDHRLHWIFLVGMVVASLAVPARARQISEAQFIGDLPVVLSASRLSQSLQDAPVAVTVIDREMIEASGLRELADLFRLVPGFYVGHGRGYFHTVSHNLSELFSRRLQVLVDGRSVYLPSFGGVRWDALPLAIEDIERIEVVRGPNAATYGANAFTGVINIITRHPADLAGNTVSMRLGEKGVREGVYRWAGGEASKHRLTFGYRHNHGFDAMHDTMMAPMLSYRGDFGLGTADALSLQAGIVGGRRGLGSAENDEDQPHDEQIRSHFQQLDWRRELSGGQALQAKLYHNYLSTRETVPTLFEPPFLERYDRNLVTQRWHAEIQHELPLSSEIRAAWGAMARLDSVESLHYFNQSDPLYTQSYSFFGHLEWRLASQWLVNAGAMLEDHRIGGAHASPRLSLHWQPSERHSFRTTISRSYRNPIQLEENGDLQISLAPLLPPLPLLLGPGDLNPEEIVSAEVGYLGNWPELGLTLDVRLFRDRVKDLITLPVDPEYPRVFRNTDKARLVGFDGQLRWRPLTHSQIVLNFARTHSESSDMGVEFSRSTPKYQYSALLVHRFPLDLDVSLGYYHTSEIRVIGGGPIPSQERLDLRLARAFQWEGARGGLALVMQNLGDPYFEYDNEQENLFDRRGYVEFRLEY